MKERVVPARDAGYTPGVDRRRPPSPPRSDDDRLPYWNLIELKEVDKMETTMHTMNPDTAISRAEAAPAETAPERQADMVSRGEFRLLLWMGAFALTAILGGMTVLYTGITDLRVAMEAQRAELLTAMEAQRADLLDVMHSEFADLRERVVRIETRLDTITPPPT